MTKMSHGGDCRVGVYTGGCVITSGEAVLDVGLVASGEISEGVTQCRCGSVFLLDEETIMWC